MSHNSSSDEEDSMPSDIMRATDEAMTVSAVIPERSRSTYESCYKNFCEWLKESKIKTITQQVMLTYFMHKSKTRQSTTLWSEYSKLKCMIYFDRNVDISRFAAVSAFLKRKSIGHVAKKSSMLTKAHFDRFITEADDDEYLMMKAVLIIGIAGALRREELLRLSTKDVVDTGEVIQVDVVDTKSDMPKQLAMTENSVGNCHLMGILRNYMSKRNGTTPHDRFFVGYRSGKCTTQPVGINTIGGIPKKIAKFLGVSDAGNFTGHCFRRSSPQMLFDSGAEFSVLRIAAEGLRRMIPYNKQQSQSNAGQTSKQAKLQLKSEPNPTSDQDNYENVELEQQNDEDLEDEEVPARQDSECESKSQIFNINYVVPSSLIIREHQTEQHTTNPSGSSYQLSSAVKDTNRTTLIDQPSTDESDHDHLMQDDPGEVLPDNGNSYSLSTQEKIDKLRLQEMHNRVTESQLRCKVQQLIVNKAEEEFKHLQEMNRLRLQEAKMRVKLLERNCANGGVNAD